MSNSPPITANANFDVYTEPVAPYRILWASDPWMSFCGYSPEELQGQTLSILQGPLTERERLDDMMQALAEARWPCTYDLTNYTKGQLPFQHRVTIEPLLNGAGVPVIYRARSALVRLLDARLRSLGEPVCDEADGVLAKMAACRLERACVATAPQ